jgi:hypothetical protein
MPTLKTLRIYIPITKIQIIFCWWRQIKLWRGLDFRRLPGPSLSLEADPT